MNLITKNKTLAMPTFNLPAIKTCPNATDACLTYCYAQHGNFNRLQVKERHEFNLTETKKDSFIEQLTKELKYRKYFRWHSSGDIYNEEYLDKIYQVILNTPNTFHLIYTRWNGNDPKLHYLNTLANCNIFLSYDPGITDIKPRLNSAFVHPTLSTCKKQTHKGTTCRTCLYCYTKQDNPLTVIFKIH